MSPITAIETSELSKTPCTVVDASLFIFTVFALKYFRIKGEKLTRYRATHVYLNILKGKKGGSKS